MTGNYQLFQWLGDYLSFFITFLIFVMTQTFLKNK
jgi:hypothetical protein